VIHEACRSCHVPPRPAAKDGTLNDCAVCHGPERAPESIYRLLPDRVLTPEVSFDDSVPAPEREPWTRALLARLADSPLTVVPGDAEKSLPVSIAVTVESGEGRTDRGAPFFAARAAATIRLHRVEIRVTARPGVAVLEKDAVHGALANLVSRVYLALTW
jgi:hypothetical protein